MDPLTSPRVLRELMVRHGFHFTKRLGQNFLIDDNILMKIAEGAMIEADDQILEIGPGVGTMTRVLAQRAKTVTAVEIDRALLPILEETLQDFDNVHIIHGDILKLDLSDLITRTFDGGPFKMVANLPYYITTPIIMRFLEEDQPFTTLVVMVQKEVAERMAAIPGTKDYGALSIAVQFHTHPRIIGRVPASVFMPPPKVDSVVIALDKRVGPAVSVGDRRLFFRIVKAAFAQRRKTLLNTLSASGVTGRSREEFKVILNRLGIDPGRRGETLDLNEFAVLCTELEEKRDLNS